jgi:hypothetical protein
VFFELKGKGTVLEFCISLLFVVVQTSTLHVRVQSSTEQKDLFTGGFPAMLFLGTSSGHKCTT